jgi:hypothetical protein
MCACMCKHLLNVSIQEASRLTRSACTLQRHGRHAQGAGWASQVSINRLCPVEASKLQPHASGPPAGARNHQTLSAAGAPANGRPATARRCRGVVAITDCNTPQHCSGPLLVLECQTWVCRGVHSMRFGNNSLMPGVFWLQELVCATLPHCNEMLLSCGAHAEVCSQSFAHRVPLCAASTVRL